MSHAGPKPASVQAALRETTERLARELADPATVAPSWSELEWRVARAAAALHGVSALLCTALPWQGPEGWNAFLACQRSHTLARHARIQALLAQVHDRARAHGVALVALKGAALHTTGLYRPGERPMADLDLLVEPHQARTAMAMLASLGFEELHVNWKHRVLAPARREVRAALGEHADNYLKIELHERIVEMLPHRPYDITAKVFPERAEPGVNGYPSNASLLIHLLFHAAGAMAYRALRLIHLNDLVRLCRRLSSAEWDEVLDPLCAEQLWWALPPLRLTSRYFPDAVPERALATLANGCPWLVSRLARRRTLSEVSLSYPWIEAFPGIGWAQSIGEALGYAGSRIVPNRQTLALRELATRNEMAASRSEWHRSSQFTRILRWMTSRPAREETLLAVREALAQPN